MRCPCGAEIFGSNKIEDYCTECNKSIQELLDYYKIIVKDKQVKTND